MTGRPLPGVLLSMALLSSPPASSPVPRTGGEPDERNSPFVERVRESTARYHDRAQALADGYRPIGRDFPGMGEHWVNVGLLFDGRYEPTRPEFLSYVTIDGRPRLLGIAYGLPLLAGESPPDEPAGRDAWHAHAGSLDEETFLPHHHESSHAEGGPRLAMVHAWIWLRNPDGVFAADNWSIPFLRLGLEAPDAPFPAAAKALSLLTGGSGYVADVVARAQEASEAGAGVRDALLRAEAAAASLVHGRTGVRLDRGELEALDSIWRRLWGDIEKKVPIAARERLKGSAVR